MREKREEAKGRRRKRNSQPAHASKSSDQRSKCRANHQKEDQNAKDQHEHERTRGEKEQGNRQAGRQAGSRQAGSKQSEATSLTTREATREASR
ncbi:uncharacterized protein BKA78DRAFT_328495 [Phyllosticta capitalensis]|uniref:uncharacterized protein n=1 Tax=Phyllosticta capitalensis TaxID=121624 RepID=UPI00313223D7